MNKNVAGVVFGLSFALLSVYISEIAIIKNNLHLNSFIIAIFFGFILSNLVKLPDIVKPGITFTLKKLLRLAIILLGFKISLNEIVTLGLNGLFVITIAVISCFFFTVWFGSKIGLDKKLSLLLASGTSICGASAIIATGGVIKAEEKDSAIGVAVISIIGTLMMAMYPIIFHAFNLGENLYSVWTGSSIQEVAQVVGAGFAVNEQVGKLSSLVKMSRVTFIVPITTILLFLEIKKIQSDKKESIKMKDLNIPWFVLIFVGTIFFNSFKLLPEPLVKNIITLDNILLASAMFCMGLGISFSKIKEAGMKPIYLGLASAFQISLTSFIISYLIF